MGSVKFIENEVVFHPGYYIEELIDSLNTTTAGFAFLVGLPKETVEALVDGKMPMTKRIARKLYCRLGASEEFWMNLQQKYDEMTGEITNDNTV